MSLDSPTYNDEFALFLESYLPHVRREGYGREMRKAFDIDGRFAAEFQHTRRYLLADRNNWGEDIAMNLARKGALGDEFSRTYSLELRSLYRFHTRIFRMGRFDDEYLRSIETIGLFFAYHDIRTLWVAGAYKEQTIRLIDVVFERQAANKRIPIKSTLHALTTALTIELQQIQRTFTMYERYVSGALVRDLSTTGLLTTTGQGMASQTVSKPPITDEEVIV